MDRKTFGMALLMSSVVVFGVVSCEKQSSSNAAACPLPSVSNEVVGGQPVAGSAANERRAVALERGKQIASEAMKKLSGRLASALESGGVSNALSACSVEALPLTRAVAQSNEVVLRRVTHRPRNPTNRADEVELKILEAFRRQLETAEASSVAPVAVSGPGVAATFYAPIVLNNPLCLNCHGQPGTDIRPANLAVIERLYPDDEATGFRLGDLRGMWRIDFADAAAARKPEPGN